MVKRYNEEEKYWEELETRYTQIPSLQDTKYIEAPLQVIKGMILAVISRLRVDRRSITFKETKFESSVDSKVKVAIQRNSVRFNAEVGLTVLPIQSSMVERVKEKSESAKKHLSASGNLISVKTDRKLRSPVIISVPIPGGRKARELPKTMRRGSYHSIKSEKDINETADEDHLFLAFKSQNKWHHLKDGPDISILRDVASFEMDINKADRCVLLKVNEPELSSSTIAKMASEIEDCTRLTPIQMITKQKSQDRSQVYLQVCSSDASHNVILKLNQQGYDDGPLPSAEVVVREGQKLDFRFSGNIQPDHKDCLAFTFNCNLRNSMREVFIKEMDKFDQRSLPEYRGYTELWMKTTDDFNSVVKMPVTLPKTDSRNKNIPKKAFIPPPQEDILNEELLRVLSGELEEDWQRLAEALRIKHSLIPSLKLQHEDDVKGFVYDMLKTWYSRLGVMTHKSDVLRNALKMIQRPDLARLLDPNGQTNKQSVWNKVIRQLSKNHVNVIKQWKELFRTLVEDLDLDPEVMIHSIDQEVKTDMEHCSLALRKWRDLGGVVASPEALIHALRSVENVQAAEEMEDIFRKHGMY